MSDLPSCQLASEIIILYADDAVNYYSSTDLSGLESKLNSDLATVSNWFSSNLLTRNISKCNFVIFGNSRKLKLVKGAVSHALRMLNSLKSVQPNKKSN